MTSRPDSANKNTKEKPKFRIPFDMKPKSSAKKPDQTPCTELITPRYFTEQKEQLTPAKEKEILSTMYKQID